MNRSNLTLVRQTCEIQLSYGFDRCRGFSASVTGPGDFYCHYYSIVDDYRGLAGLLETLVETGAFEPEQIMAALTALLLETPENGIDDPEIRCVAGILEWLKDAARE